MPTIKLTEALGLGVDGKLAEGAGLLTLLPAFTRLTDLPLDQVPVADASGVLIGSQPIDVGAGIGLQFGGSGGGRYALIGHAQRALDEDDPFSEIAVLENEMYVALALSFSATAGVNGSFGPATLGFSGEQGFEIRCYRRFLRGPAGFPAFGPAFAATAGSFLLPKDVPDVGKLDPDVVLVLRSTGSLTVSGGISVSMPVQSLASVSLPGNMKLEAKAGAEVDVSAGITISGGYQVRLRRTAGSLTELGIYRLKSREADFAISAKAGVTASAGGFELTERLIGILSRQPVVDREEFQAALPDENPAAKTRRIEGFEAGLQAAVSTKVQLSVAAAWSRLSSREPAWLFQIDTATGGVRETSSILTSTDARKVSVTINLLGLANAISAKKLVQVTTTEHNGNGDVTLVTDSLTSSRLQALLFTFGTDGKRLRKLLSEDFLITAAYRAKDAGVLPPDFKARHRYFEIHDTTGRDEMKNNLDVVRLLGLLSPEKVDAVLSGNRNFGRTDFYAETAYSSGAVRTAFDAQDYEAIGRRALGALLAGDRGQEFRQRVAADDALWLKLKETQNRAAFPPLFGLPAGSVDPRVEAAGADFMVIQNWAQAMSAAGKAIRDVDTLPAEKARDILKQRLSDVVKNTREEFGDPLGMVMFYGAAKGNAERKAVLRGDKIETLELSAGDYNPSSDAASASAAASGPAAWAS